MTHKWRLHPISTWHERCKSAKSNVHLQTTMAPLGHLFCRKPQPLIKASITSISIALRKIILLFPLAFSSLGSWYLSPSVVVSRDRKGAVISSHSSFPSVLPPYPKKGFKKPSIPSPKLHPEAIMEVVLRLVSPSKKGSYCLV